MRSPSASPAPASKKTQAEKAVKTRAPRSHSNYPEGPTTKSDDVTKGWDKLYRGRSPNRAAARTGRGMPDNVDPAVGGTRGKKSKEVIDHIAALANLPPAMQALAEKPYLNTKVAARNKPRAKRRPTGWSPFWNTTTWATTATTSSPTYRPRTRTGAIHPRTKNTWLLV